MFCRKCGNELSDVAKFCKVCGSKVDDEGVANDGASQAAPAPAAQPVAPTPVAPPVIKTNMPPMPPANGSVPPIPPIPGMNNNAGGGIQKKKSALPIVITLIVLLVVGIAAAVIIFIIGDNSSSSAASGSSYSKKLKMAERYYNDEEYEKALACYEEAIEINPKKADAYVGMADVYIALDDEDMAIEVLESIDVELDKKNQEIIDNKINAIESGDYTPGIIVPEKEDKKDDKEAKIPEMPSVDIGAVDIRSNLPEYDSDLSNIKVGDQVYFGAYVYSNETGYEYDGAGYEYNSVEEYDPDNGYSSEYDYGYDGYDYDEEYGYDGYDYDENYGYDGVNEFGYYEEEYDDGVNGAISKNGEYAPIKWDVVAIDGDTAFLVSHYVLEHGNFDNGNSADWESSDIRAYLNGEFYEGVFTEEEQKYIVERTNENLSSEQFFADYDTGYSYSGDGYGYAKTKDKVFLLSLNEAIKFYSELETAGDNYASLDNAGATTKAGIGTCYMLRTEGLDGSYTMHICSSGTIYPSCSSDSSWGIRPAIVVKIK